MSDLSFELVAGFHEGTVILEPEAVNDNGPYVGPEFGTAKWRPRASLTQTGGGH